MKSGVSYPSYAKNGVYAGAVGSWTGVQNLADLNKIRAVAKTATAAPAFTCILPEYEAITMVALVHHNAPADATWSVRLFSDTSPVSGGPSQIYSSGALTMYPSGPTTLNFPRVSLHFLPSTMNVRSARISLNRTDGVDWVLGGLEMAGWVEWEDTAVDVEAGLSSQDTIVEGADGADFGTEAWSPRYHTGSRQLVGIDELNLWLDFQNGKKMSEPFIWAWDRADTATWHRQCYLARNATLPAPQHVAYGAGKISFDFVEHLR